MQLVDSVQTSLAEVNEELLAQRNLQCKPVRKLDGLLEMVSIAKPKFAIMEQVVGLRAQSTAILY